MEGVVDQTIINQQILMSQADSGEIIFHCTNMKLGFNSQKSDYLVMYDERGGGKERI